MFGQKRKSIKYNRKNKFNFTHICREVIYVFEQDSYRGGKKSMANINTMDGNVLPKAGETTKSKRNV